MTCGRPPFQGESVIETIHNVLHEDPQPPSSLNHDTRPALDDVILKLLRKAPEERYASARELMEALRQVRDRAPAVPSLESLAVLPFANLGGGPEDHFGIGLADELITNLARLVGLRVVSRTSASDIKSEDVIDIGRRLRVQGVLHGSFRRAGARIRIGARLVSVATGAHLWSEKYDRDLPDVFAVQEEIAEHITEAIRRLLPRQEARTLIRRRSGAGVDHRSVHAQHLVQQQASEGVALGHDGSSGGAGEASKVAPTLTGIADHQTRLGCSV